jgi:hypothetical protein
MKRAMFSLMAILVLAGIVSAGTGYSTGMSEKKTFEEKCDSNNYYDKCSDRYSDEYPNEYSDKYSDEYQDEHCDKRDKCDSQHCSDDCYNECDTPCDNDKCRYEYCEKFWDIYHK